MASLQWYNSRVTEDLKREILYVITNRISNPKLPSMITVPAIKLAKDTRNATIMISVLGTEEDKKMAVKILNKSAAFIQNSVASRVKIKNFPKFYFKIDNTFEEQDSITALLNKVKDDLDRPDETNSGE
jgi:ribosome-binding factor A